MLNIKSLINNGFIPYKYSFRAINPKKALCIVKKENNKYICIKTKEKAAYTDIVKEFSEENSYFTIFKLNWNNYEKLNKSIDINPKKQNKKISVGLGDRTGKAIASLIRTVNLFDVFPVIAQQTPQELKNLKSSYKSCLLNSIMGILETGYQGDWGADANCIYNENQLSMAIDAKYSMFTIDIHPFIRKINEYNSFNELYNKLNDTSKQIIKQVSSTFFGQYNDYFNEENIIQSAYSLEKALDIVCKYNNIIKNNIKNFDLEISLNNSEEITTPCDYLFICLYLSEKKVEFTSYAPKLIGEFYPECDYVGNINNITKQLTVFENISSKYGDHKISIHSSNKYSLYKIINEITNGHYHIKTSGTNWLRVPLLASIHNKELFDKMLKIAFDSQKKQIIPPKHPDTFIKNKEQCIILNNSYDIILNELEWEINSFLSDYEKEYYYLIGKNIEAHLQ